MSQHEYYAGRGLFPSRIFRDDVAALARQTEITRNLYEHLLGLPMAAFRGWHVLDLGCGTGDSALVLARLGARLTLVDADPRVWPLVAELFARDGLTDRIVEQVTRTAEEYLPESTFDFIRAEGFLFTCVNRSEIARRLLAALEPNGFLSISMPDPLGSFMEFLKKKAFLLGCRSAGVADIFSPEALAVGKSLFAEAHALLPSPRPFEVWLEDCVCSPFLTTALCWSAREVLDELAPEGAVYYGSSPRIAEADRLGWYKDVMDGDRINAVAGAGYDARAADFVFGIPVLFATDADRAAFLSLGRTYLERLSTWFSRPETAVPVPDGRWLDAIGRSTLPPDIAQHLRAFFDLARAADAGPFVDRIGTAKALFSIWGKSYHYLVVRRRA